MSDATLRNTAADAAALNLEGSWYAVLNAGIQVSNERLQPAYSPAAAGQAALSAPLVFTGPGGQTVTHLGVYSAATGGSPRFTVPLSGDLAFNTAGELTVTAAPITVS